MAANNTFEWDARKNSAPPLISDVNCKQMRIISLVEHSENWSTDFEKEARSITSILSENLVASYHIGSTAISGLKAKPVIDILLEERSLSEVDRTMESWKGLDTRQKENMALREGGSFRKEEVKEHITFMYLKQVIPKLKGTSYSLNL